MRYKETEVQKIVVRHIQVKYPDVLFTASTAGVKLPMRTAINLKRMGAIAGVPDLLIFRSNHGYHGMLLELKAEDGRLDPKGAQKAFQEKANAEGYKCVVAYGAAEAITIVDEYLR